MSISKEFLGKIETEEGVTSTLGVDNKGRVGTDRDGNTASMDSGLGGSRSECSPAERRAASSVHGMMYIDVEIGGIEWKIRNKIMGCSKFGLFSQIPRDLEF